MKFTQQFDPFQKKINNNSRDGYGPSILTTLEFISRLHGTHITRDRIFWSSIDNNHSYNYRQKWNNLELEIHTKKEGLVSCIINDDKIATFSSGVRLVTDLHGHLIEIVGITGTDREITVDAMSKKYSLTVKPNSVYKMNTDGEFILARSVPFTYQ
jgi:hypothetical protein